MTRPYSHVRAKTYDLTTYTLEAIAEMMLDLEDALEETTGELSDLKEKLADLEAGQ